MSSSEKRILVVKREKLFCSDYFEGFRHVHEIDYETRILHNLEIMRRGSREEPENHPEGNAERNPAYKQPIAYTLVVNPEAKKVFAYKRAEKTSEYSETRLQGKWSWGFGGHIEPFDAKNGNLIRNSMLRELNEELKIRGEIKNVEVLGYVNYDSDDIGNVHFGILYVMETNAKHVETNKEAILVEAKTVRELEALCRDPSIEVEEWSKIALQPLGNFLGML